MLKIQLYITGMSYILKYIHIENIYFEIAIIFHMADSARMELYL